MAYSFIKQYLQGQAFSVYPHEMICGPINCPHKRNRFVDVVARKNGKYYAFEYKSSMDPVIRAIHQLENYRLSFDYVVLLAEFPRFDLSLNTKEGKDIKKLNIQKFIELGAGVWKVEFIKIRANAFERSLIAGTFKQVSDCAPLVAHHIGIKTDDKLQTNSAKWFWLFYSALDRRSNASTFIKAKQALEKEDLFSPPKIVKLIEEVGKEQAISRIWQILREAHFPLLKDSVKGNLSHPTSIVEAAQFIGKFNYDFDLLYRAYREKVRNIKKARNMLWKDLAEQIYGMGWRSTSQFVRGMVLRSGWKFPLDDNRYLESCEFNYFMASKLGLAFKPSEYTRELGKLADEYLNGNRGIISHALWVIRKRYCKSVKFRQCHECPLFNLCFREKGDHIKVVEVIKPRLQNPIPQNKDWIKQKFLHYGSNLKTLNILPDISQKTLDCY